MRRNPACTPEMMREALQRLRSNVIPAVPPSPERFRLGRLADLTRLPLPWLTQFDANRIAQRARVIRRQNSSASSCIGGTSLSVIQATSELFFAGAFAQG